MSSWPLGLLLAVGACALALVYLWAFRRRRDETEAGLRLLAGLRWRELSTLVRQAMHEQRDLVDAVSDYSDQREPSSSLVMTKQGRRWLLLCKHGRAYRIGANVIDELAGEMQLHGAGHGILLTEGRVERDGHAAAGRQHVEIICGWPLWQLLKPYVDDSQRQRIVEAASHRASRHSFIAALAALALGVVFVWGHSILADAPTGATPIAISTPAPAVVANAAVAATTPAQDAAKRADADDAEFERQQQAVSKALADKSGIVRGIWPTRMTLAIDREADDTSIWPVICRELERYPALRTARVQLNPRPGSSDPVRWRQCHTY